MKGYRWDIKEISVEDKRKNKKKLLNKILSLSDKGVSVSDISKITNITTQHIYRVIKTKQFNKRRVRKKSITPIVVNEIVDRVLKVGSVRKALIELKAENFLKSNISNITYRRYVKESDTYIKWIESKSKYDDHYTRQSKKIVNHWNKYSLESSVLTKETIKAFEFLGLEVPNK